MSRALLFLTAIVLFASCLKKSTANQKSWACERNDSMVSNIPALNNDHYKYITENYNQVNEEYIRFLIKKNTYTDTFFFRHDTLMQEYWTMGCTLIE